MSTREQALKQITEIASRHNITIREFSDLMSEHEDRETSITPLKRVIAYLGGIFLFSGIGAYINMFWHEMNSFERLIITLGSGVVLHVMALMSLRDSQYFRAASPLFIMAAVLQPTGLFVMIDEWHIFQSDGMAVFFVSSLMLIQQASTFYYTRHSTSMFFSFAYAIFFFMSAYYLLGMDSNLNGVIVGISTIAAAYGIGKIRHTSMSGLWYLIGSMLFFICGFEILKDTPLELGFLVLGALMIYIGVLSHSRLLMSVSVGAILFYIAYFTIQNFLDSIGWPITLILFGLLCCIISSGAWKLNKIMVIRVTDENTA